MGKGNTPVDGSSHRNREHLLAVPSGLIEQHDGVNVLGEARGQAIEEYIHGAGIDLGEDEREGIVGGRPHGGIEVGGNEALVGEARRTLALKSCVCIGRGRKQNEKAFIALMRARLEHQTRLQQSRAQAV